MFIAEHRLDTSAPAEPDVFLTSSTYIPLLTERDKSEVTEAINILLLWSKSSDGARVSELILACATRENRKEVRLTSIRKLDFIPAPQ